MVAIARIIRGGFPLALARGSAASRSRWFDDYLDLTMQRDIDELANLRKRALMPTFLARIAGQTAQPLNVTAASSASPPAFSGWPAIGWLAGIRSP